MRHDDDHALPAAEERNAVAAVYGNLDRLRHGGPGLNHG